MGVFCCFVRLVMFLVVLILILKNFAPIADSNNIEVAKLLRLQTGKLDRDDLALHRQVRQSATPPSPGYPSSDDVREAFRDALDARQDMVIPRPPASPSIQWREKTGSIPP